jgi:hypothetical protein
MYAKIKDLADEAIALQNKDRMDAALREISGLCASAAEAQPTEPPADEHSSALAVDGPAASPTKGKKGGSK